LAHSCFPSLSEGKRYSHSKQLPGISYFERTLCRLFAQNRTYVFFQDWLPSLT